MTHSSKSTSKTGRKAGTGKSKGATQAASSGKALKQSQLDELSGGKLLAEHDKKQPWPPCGTDE
jgi:hypothetical protein